MPGDLNSMDVLKMLADLRRERAQIEEAILTLERLARGRGKRRGRPPAWMAALSGVVVRREVRIGLRKRRRHSALDAAASSNAGNTAAAFLSVCRVVSFRESGFAVAFSRRGTVGWSHRRWPAHLCRVKAAVIDSRPPNRFPVIVAPPGTSKLRRSGRYFRAMKPSPASGRLAKSRLVGDVLPAHCGRKSRGPENGRKTSAHIPAAGEPRS